MRFVHNLLPTLEAAKSPRVVSVLAGGKESVIEADNLDLRKKFSLSASTGYPATLNSLAMEVLASQHPSVSFIHVFPGIVATPLFKKTFGSVLGSVVMFISSFMSISPQESGEWQTYLSTSPSFPAKNSPEKSTAAARASTGEVGGGSYILNYDGKDVTNKSLMTNLREKGFPDIVWKHTLETFDRILA